MFRYRSLDEDKSIPGSVLGLGIFGSKQVENFTYQNNIPLLFHFGG